MKKRIATGVNNIDGVRIPSDLWGCRTPLLAVRWYMIHRDNKPCNEALGHIEAALHIVEEGAREQLREELRSNK